MDKPNLETAPIADGAVTARAIPEKVERMTNEQASKTRIAELYKLHGYDGSEEYHVYNVTEPDAVKLRGEVDLILNGEYHNAYVLREISTGIEVVKETYTGHISAHIAMITMQRIHYQLPPEMRKD